jgi:hypothetical protein
MTTPLISFHRAVDDDLTARHIEVIVDHLATRQNIRIAVEHLGGKRRARKEQKHDNCQPSSYVLTPRDTRHYSRAPLWALPMLVGFGLFHFPLLAALFASLLVRHTPHRFLANTV